MATVIVTRRDRDYEALPGPGAEFAGKLNRIMINGIGILKPNTSLPLSQKLNRKCAFRVLDCDAVPGHRSSS